MTIETDNMFITATEADQENPRRLAELLAEAKRTGKMLIQEPPLSFEGKEIRTGLERLAMEGLPTVKGSDNRAVMRNLDAIGRGDVVVVDSET